MQAHQSIPAPSLAGRIAALFVAGLTGTSVAAQENIDEVVVLGERDLSRSTSIGKLDVPVTETPFSITVRDKDFLDSVGAKTVQDGLLYSAGVAGGPYGIDSRGDWSFIRGVEPVMYVDGLQSLFGSYTGARAAAYAYERTEILKGPSSVLYGQGSTGGVVNLVSKRPHPDFSGEVMVQGGSYDRQVVAGDVGGAIDRDGQFLYRMVAYGRKADAQVNHVPDDSTLLMPSISWRPGTNTDLTFLYSKQSDNSGTTAGFVPWQGTLLDNPNGELPTDTFLSEPGWDKYDTEQDNYSLWLDHRINDVFSLNANARYSDGEVDYNSMWGRFTGSPAGRYEADMRTLERTAYMADSSSNMWIYDIRMTAEFATGPLEHMVSFGYDSINAESEQAVQYGVGDPIDAFAPQYGNIPTAFSPPSPAVINSTDQEGIYIQDQMHWNSVIVNLGARTDDTASEVQGGTAFEDDADTYRFGVMYEFGFGLSPYLSYSESFEPVNDTNDVTGEPYKPVEGEQWEAGLKYLIPDTNLLVTLSVYDITQVNRLEPDPLNPMNQIQTGEAGFEGVELEVSGRIGQFDISANYSDMDMDPVQQAVPETEYSLWTKYNFANALEGLYMGAGMRYSGESATGIEGYENPDYTLYDAVVGYRIAQWSLQLNGNNLTDEAYTASCIARGDCFFGERRYITAEARYSF